MVVSCRWDSSNSPDHRPTQPQPFSFNDLSRPAMDGTWLRHSPFVLTSADAHDSDPDPRRTGPAPARYLAWPATSIAGCQDPCSDPMRLRRLQQPACTAGPRPVGPSSAYRWRLSRALIHLYMSQQGTIFTFPPCNTLGACTPGGLPVYYFGCLHPGGVLLSQVGPPRWMGSVPMGSVSHEEGF